MGFHVIYHALFTVRFFTTNITKVLLSFMNNSVMVSPTFLCSETLIAKRARILILLCVCVLMIIIWRFCRTQFTTNFTCKCLLFIVMGFIMSLISGSAIVLYVTAFPSTKIRNRVTVDGTMLCKLRLTWKFLITFRVWKFVESMYGTSMLISQKYSWKI